MGDFDVVGTYAIFIAFSRFRNIDLSDKGYYCVRLRITDLLGKRIATPTQISEVPVKFSPRDHKADKLPQLPRLSLDGSWVYCSNLWIEYEREEYAMNDYLAFEYENQTGQPLLVHFEFFHSHNDEFEEVDRFQTKSVKIQDIDGGVHQYWELYSDEFDMASYDVTFHIALRDTILKQPVKGKATKRRFPSISSSTTSSNSWLRLSPATPRGSFDREFSNEGTSSQTDEDRQLQYFQASIRLAVQNFVRLTNVLRYATQDIPMEIMSNFFLRVPIPHLVSPITPRRAQATRTLDDIDLQIQEPSSPSFNVWSDEDVDATILSIKQDAHSRGKDNLDILSDIFNKVGLLWSLVTHGYQYISENCTRILKKTRFLQIREEFDGFIHKDDVVLQTSQGVFRTKKKASNKYIAKQIRRKGDFGKQSICDYSLGSPHKYPIFFDQTWYRHVVEPPALEEDQRHFIVYVHGFQGSVYDCRIIRGHMIMLFPNFVHFVSRSNERRTHDSIDEMGERLVNEILHEIQLMPSKPSRISFIGHSLGGLIVRAAIQNSAFAPYLDLLYTYISLSSPHLGTLKLPGFLVSSGMRIWSLISNSTCLNQLLLKDRRDNQTPFLVRLTENEKLGKFRYVLLLSSEQDEYVPWSSARIEVKPNEANNPYIAQMVGNLETAIQVTNARRIDVTYHIEGFDTSTFVGQRAHVMILEGGPYLKGLLDYLRDCFL
eukprot:TRINITY_DN10757_c0_g1_i1.p1 TRINITY_DN10757_c0_g1~~TRINITY_DN10757_c0_g1_i1.p1  ORF type:complete len:715 (+),score=139.79 TRINITY_DN10757_c0_g1_i1:43-2187(+)